jgi:hypothetical protein
VKKQKAVWLKTAVKVIFFGISNFRLEKLLNFKNFKCEKLLNFQNFKFQI